MCGTLLSLVIIFRVQVDQGEELKPICLDVNVMLESLRHFSAALNFSSNFTSLPDTGLEVYNKKDGWV